MSLKEVMTETETGTGTPKKRSGGRTARVAFLLLVVLLIAGAFLAGLLPKLRQREQLATETHAAEATTPLVSVAKAHSGAATVPLALPGNVEAIQVASIFARTNGYLKAPIKQLGEHVKAGETVAEVEAPETDQETQQAKANVSLALAALKQKQAALQQAKANLSLAEVTLNRWKKLAGEGVFSQQAADEKQSTFDVQKANVEAAEADIRASEENIRSQQANVRRLEQLQSYQKVTAPFDGYITARNLDPGALITAGSSSGVREIYKLAQIDLLRIYVPVPQTYVPAVKVGQTVNVNVQEYPNRKFTGKVIRLANSLDPASRTQLTEIHVSNAGHTLLPGMYAQVEFLMVNRPALVVPAPVLSVKSDGTYAVAVVGPGNRVHYQSVKTGKDLGTEVEVISGLTGEEQMVMNPPDDLAEGTEVRVAASPPSK